MAKSLSLGNGSLLVNLDEFAHVRDLYFPHVGLENHVGGHFFEKHFYCVRRPVDRITEKMKIHLNLFARSHLDQGLQVLERRVRVCFCQKAYEINRAATLACVVKRLL